MSLSRAIQTHTRKAASKYKRTITLYPWWSRKRMDAAIEFSNALYEYERYKKNLEGLAKIAEHLREMHRENQSRSSIGHTPG